MTWNDTEDYCHFCDVVRCGYEARHCGESAAANDDSLPSGIFNLTHSQAKKACMNT